MKYLTTIFVLATLLLTPSCVTDGSPPEKALNTNVVNLGFPNKQYEMAYYITEVCTGLRAPPPSVIIVDSDSWGFGNQYLGLYFQSRQTAFIRVLEGYDPILVAMHEYTHHLLIFNRRDSTHNSPLFDKCSFGSNLQK